MGLGSIVRNTAVTVASSLLLGFATINNPGVQGKSIPHAVSDTVEYSDVIGMTDFMPSNEEVDAAIQRFSNLPESKKGAYVDRIEDIILEKTSWGRRFDRLRQIYMSGFDVRFVPVFPGKDKEYLLGGIFYKEGEDKIYIRNRSPQNQIEEFLQRRQGGLSGPEIVTLFHEINHHIVNESKEEDFLERYVSEGDTEKRLSGALAIRGSAAARYLDEEGFLSDSSSAKKLEEAWDFGEDLMSEIAAYYMVNNFDPAQIANHMRSVDAYGYAEHVPRRIFRRVAARIDTLRAWGVDDVSILGALGEAADSYTSDGFMELNDTMDFYSRFLPPPSPERIREVRQERKQEEIEVENVVGRYLVTSTFMEPYNTFKSLPISIP